MNTPAKFLFVMDPYEALNLETETSLLFMQELLKRGHLVYWLQEQDIALVQDQPMGHVYQVTHAEPLERGEPEWSNLNGYDAVLVRKDPPFDSGFLQLTLILDHLDSSVTQFNDVSALRNFNEKILPLRWPDLTPPSLISMNADQIETFVNVHESVILKPLDDCSGRGISKIDSKRPGDNNALIRSALVDAQGKPRFLVAQKFLDEVKSGDKRVFLVNGEPVGMVNRIPGIDSFLANIHQGARCESTLLSHTEDAAIKRIAPFLQEEGIFLAGADFIGGYLTELNITSPSAVRQINEVSGQRIEPGIIDAMLAYMGISEPALPDLTSSSTIPRQWRDRCCDFPCCINV